MKINFKLSQTQKVTLALVAVCLFSSEIFAQSGVTGITAATNQIKTYITPACNIALAIGGVVGIVSSVRIYQKWNSGDQDINKELMSFGGSCVFLIVAPLVVKGFFGL